MSWAEDRARSVIASSRAEVAELDPAGNFRPTTMFLVERAIRETIEQCAEICEADGLTGIRLGADIRKLGEAPR